MINQQILQAEWAGRMGRNALQKTVDNMNSDLACFEKLLQAIADGESHAVLTARAMELGELMRNTHDLACARLESLIAEIKTL